MEDEIRELWRSKLYATLAAAYRYLFPDFICQSITIAQRIKSLVRTHVYYFVYRYSDLFSHQRLFTADLTGDQYHFSPFASTWVIDFKLINFLTQKILLVYLMA